jgi:hypothetical protein
MQEQFKFREEEEPKGGVFANIMSTEGGAFEKPYLGEVTDEEHCLVEGKEIINQQDVMPNKTSLCFRGGEWG